MFPETIFDYITQQENEYQSGEITVGDNWRWSMRQHVQMLFHLRNGMFFKGANDFNRAFKNVMEPIIDLANWTEDLEVKDILFYIENANGRGLSFLIKKYHDEVYTREHDMDDLLDEITEGDNSYGGVLIDTSKKKRPEGVSLMEIAFCDQTDIEGNPIGFKRTFAPSKLKAMEKQGWGSEANGAEGTISDLIAKATFDKDPEGARKGNTPNDTPGKNIEVYIVHGPLAKGYLDDSNDLENTENALFVVAFYYDEKNNKQGFTLYRKKEAEGTLLFFASKEVEGRALGRGVGEQMVHPQIWTNFLEIHKQKMLEAGAKIPLVTDDESFTNRQQVMNMENLEVTTVADGKTIKKIDTLGTANIQLYQNAINDWFQYAQYTGQAFDSLMGKEESAGTTFRGQERLVAQGRGPHDRKRGKRAKFVEKIYREHIIPQMKREILSGKEFLVSLDSDDMTWLMEQLAENHANRERNEAVVSGKLPGDKEVLKQKFKEDFQKGGNRRLLGILKEEFRNVEIKMGINISGKQKNLVDLSDKLLSIFQFAFSNPQAFQQAMQQPALAKTFNDILEFSGIPQADFSSMMAAPIQAPIGQPTGQQGGQPQQPAAQPSPLQLNQSTV